MKKILLVLTLCSVFVLSSANLAVGQIPPIYPIPLFLEKAIFEKWLELKELSSAPTHVAGYGMVYVKASDSDLYFKDSSGNESSLTGAGGAGTVDTSGTPVDNDFAKFTDADTIEGRSYSETASDLEAEIESAIDTLPNLTSVGTLGTGVWQGTAVADAYVAGAATWDAKQAGHALLTSFAAQTYASGSYSAITGANTVAIRTYAQVLSDIGAQSLNTVLTELTALTDPAADKFAFWNNTTNNFEWSTVITPTATGVTIGAAGNVGKWELEDADGDALGMSVGVQAGDTDYVWPTAFPGTTGFVLSSTTGGTLSWDSDVTAQVAAASTGAAGKSELATTAEVSAGVDTTRAVTADALAGSTIGRKTMIWKLTANDEVIVDQDDYDSILVPADFAGWLITGVAARIVTADDGAEDMDIGIYNVTQTAEILSTLMQIEATEWTTLTSAQPGVIDVGEDDITAGDVIRIDVDYGGDNCTGLEVHITFERVT